MAKKGWVKRMGQRELGRYCEEAIGKYQPCGRSKWWRKKKKVSKMRAYLQKPHG